MIQIYDVCRSYVLNTFFVAMLVSSCTGIAQDNKQLVRIAVIEVDSAQLPDYHNFLVEEIEASIRLEPGVITLLGVAEKEHPERVILFETYGDSSAYKSHLSTPHFQKYKQGTLQMVRQLQLIETEPILYLRKPEISEMPSQNLFIRLLKMEIDTTQTDNFRNLAKRVLLPGIKKEPGILVLYAVVEKRAPAQVSILEVYTNYAAYEKHLKTPHFIKYSTESKNMVKSLKLVDVTPIALGSKTQ